MIIVFSPHQKAHVPAEFISSGAARRHPDSVERVDALLAGVGGERHEIIEPADHGLRHVRLVHTARYLDFLEHAWEAWRLLPGASAAVVPNVHPRRMDAAYPRSVVGRAGFHLYDLASPIEPSTWGAALWSAHSAAEAALRVRAGACTAAYASCRPPGHHAGADFAGGFCYLNNAAIAAAVLRQRWDRIAVLDVDVHHGNGTQDIFYERDDVLTVSLHGDPADFYPFFWGHPAETGGGRAHGANLNVPLARGLGDDDYLGALQPAFERIRSHGSGALVVALGFDTYEHDPLAWLKLTTDAYRRVGAAVAALDLPVVFVQEGGYFCEHLGRNLAAFLGGFEAHSRVQTPRRFEGASA